MTDIVKRIKLAAKVFNFTRAGIELLQDCADEITRLRADNETLQEKEKDYLEMLMTQAQTITAQWKMIGSVDKMETGK